ncbi:MAG TPA: ABC transporter substrate-binding protein [Crenalkalicoccus sp.]|nr:ABC transporter substrate-binding protein [Crenalkalicoccus sp.]
MPCRRTLLAGLLAAPALLPRASLGQTRKVKIGSAFTTTTNPAFLMPRYLKEQGVEAELVIFPSLVQRMQAVAAGDVQVGNGGLSATMQVDVKGFPMVVLANGCDGGWALLARPGIAEFKALRGRKIAVQQGSIGLVSLLWKLKAEGMAEAVELVFMDNDKMPIPLYRGDVDAICCFEPYAALAKINAWGKEVWSVYETPMGKTNLGFVASRAFLEKEPDLTKLIVQAHVRATAEVIAHPEIALETTMKQFNMPRNVAEVSNANLFFTTESGERFQQGLRNLARMMVENRLLDAEPNWDRFVDTRFL